MNNDNNTEPVLYAVGARGYSAYEVAVQEGFEGTVDEWLESLIGPQGKSAYQVAVDNGYVGTPEEWLLSLRGPEGKSAYEVAVDEGYQGTEEEWVDSFLNAEGYYNKTEIDSKLEDVITEDDVINNLLSDDIDKPLSAYQGKKLSQKIDEKIASEKTARENADDVLQTQIDGLTSGAPIPVSDLADMTDTTKIYLYLTDGYWYYYDSVDEEWKQGALYQATQVADGSINLKKVDTEVMSTFYGTTKNRFNPYEMENGKAMSGANCVVVDNASYCVTGYIPVANAEKIVFYKKRYYDDTYTTHTMTPYKCALFNSSKVFVQQITRDGAIYDIPSDGFIRVQFTTANYANRYDIICINAVSQTIDPEYITHYKLGNEVYKDINYDDLNDVRPLLYRLPKLDIEEGGIANSGNTANDASDFQNYCRTKKFISLAKGTKFVCDGIAIKVFYYSDDGKALSSSSDWITTEYVATANAKNAKIAIRNNPVSPVDLSTILDDLTIVPYPETLEEKINAITPPTPTGTELAYNGEKMSFNHTCHYTQRATLNLAGQDACVYGDKLFTFANNGQFKVYDLTTDTATEAIDLDQIEEIAPHANCVCFGNEFYDADDTYPLLYVNAYNTPDLPKGTCYVYRVVESGGTYVTNLLQTIKIGFVDDPIWKSSDSEPRDYGNFLVDTDNSYYYAYTPRVADKKIRIFKFNLPKLSAGAEVTLTTSNIIEYFDIDYDRYIQGGCYYNNKLYIINNNIPEHSGKLRVVDLIQRQEVTNMSLSDLFNEPEAAFVYDNKLYLGTWGTRVYRIDF